MARLVRVRNRLDSTVFDFVSFATGNCFFVFRYRLKSISCCRNLVYLSNDSQTLLVGMRLSRFTVTVYHHTSSSWCISRITDLPLFLCLPPLKRDYSHFDYLFKHAKVSQIERMRLNARHQLARNVILVTFRKRKKAIKTIKTVNKNCGYTSMHGVSICESKKGWSANVIARGGNVISTNIEENWFKC